MDNTVKPSRDLNPFGPVFRSKNPKVFLDLIGPAVRGFLLHKGRGRPHTQVETKNDALFDWAYKRDQPEMARLYELGKASQWNASTDIDWSIDVDPFDPRTVLLPAMMTTPGARPLIRPDTPGAGAICWMLAASIFVTELPSARFSTGSAVPEMTTSFSTAGALTIESRRSVRPTRTDSFAGR